MRTGQLKEYIIKPTLKHLGLDDPLAVDLLEGIACAESLCGTFVAQSGDGPACGIYQCEPKTARDVLDYLKRRRPDLYEKVEALRCPDVGLEESLRGNDIYATAIARCFFLRFPDPIPNDEKGMAEYWKRYYNTALGAGSVDGFLEKWRKCRG